MGRTQGHNYMYLYSLGQSEYRNGVSESVRAYTGPYLSIALVSQNIEI